MSPFQQAITDNEAFQFDGDDIVRIRGELFTLISRLSTIYKAWNEEAKRDPPTPRLRAPGTPPPTPTSPHNLDYVYKMNTTVFKGASQVGNGSVSYGPSSVGGALPPTPGRRVPGTPPPTHTSPHNLDYVFKMNMTVFKGASQVGNGNGSVKVTEACGPSSVGGALPPTPGQRAPGVDVIGERLGTSVNVVTPGTRNKPVKRKKLKKRKRKPI